jgi:hypothetical protein
MVFAAYLFLTKMPTIVGWPKIFALVVLLIASINSFISLMIMSAFIGDELGKTTIIFYNNNKKIIDWIFVIFAAIGITWFMNWDFKYGVGTILINFLSNLISEKILPVLKNKK